MKNGLQKIFVETTSKEKLKMRQWLINRRIKGFHVISHASLKFSAGCRNKSNESLPR
jgi:hypothetical protein